MDYHHWAYNEARTAPFGDQRLTNRFALLLKQLGDQPAESIPAACNSWADTLAAYRFFDNEKVTFDTVLASHRGATLERCREHPVVLLIQDTTSLKYTHTPVAKGLGTLSEQESEKVFLHPTLAVTPQRVSLGVLGGEIWQRLETSPRKERRLKGIDEKESRRWVAGYQLACEVSSLVEETLIVNLADAEGDIYEWFAETLEHSPQTRAEWIIRAAQDRRLAASESSRQLREKLDRQPLLGKVAVTLPAKGEQEARIAILQVRTTRATLKAPARTGVRLGDLEVCAVLAREENPPLGQRPIDWTLLTSLPVTNLATAVQILEWYSCRWEIEVFFKLLKSGCRVEQLQLETADRRDPCVALYLIIAWRILFATHLGREEPHQSCEIVFTREEWQATHLLHDLPVPASPPSLGEMLNLVARLGGYLNRSLDGPPGPQTLWKGLRRVREAVWLLQVLKRTRIPQ
jgi:Transposase DNA-binding/Transposase Tn5 dimerisation domain/Transposase DDE domain